MKGTIVAVSVGFAVMVGGIILSGGKAVGADQTGESLFKQNCAICHGDGGNIINPKKTLHKHDRMTNGVKTADDILKKMRNPGQGMTKFDEKTIPDKDARKIAEYILKTF